MTIFHGTGKKTCRFQLFLYDICSEILSFVDELMRIILHESLAWNHKGQQHY